MANPVLKKVVVVGRDAPVWLAANAIHGALSPQGVRVEVVELPTRLNAQDVYATQPALEALHRRLGIDESQVLAATGGAFTFGQRFGEAGSPYDFFHPYGSVGTAIDNRPFIQHWLKARRFGLSVAFEDFSLTAVAAKCGRRISPDLETRAFARADYGYHLPAQAYAGYVKGLAAHRGIPIHPTRQIEVKLNDGDGTIETVGLEGGRTIGGDLFIDATGPEALLIGGALGVARESWRGLFPCDRKLSVAGARFEAIPLFAQVQAHASGWIGFYPTRQGTGLVNVYSSALQSEDEAVRTVSAAFTSASGAATVSHSDPGRRMRAWQKNCIAVGEAACAFDPIHDVDLQAVQLALVYLLALFPVAADYAAEQAEYNRLTESGFRRLGDFQAAHYALNRYGQSPLWTAARALPRSAALAHKVDTFLARGDVPLLEEEGFPIESWQSLFLGHGLSPETYSPQLDRISPDVMKAGFRDILAEIKRLVDKQPSHDSYLEIFCE